ncbi:MAG: TonB-dependent receptor [Gammaproteobacteria bacterium]|nr:TonB-dependent receptor [Gammaproteobacteria bacterium]
MRATHRFPAVNFLRLPLAAAITLAVALPAHAVLEEIVVTATKREESAQDIGLSITAFNERDYRELGGGDLDRFAGQVSNVQAYAPGSFLQSVHIRGIGLNEFQGQYDSPVAQHYDEVYISKPWMLARPAYDIQRVEALKGPQGTLFGRNTTGGALNWYTNLPTETLEMTGDAGFDNFERATIQGAVSGPITQELLGRVSFLTKFGSGGPQKNLFTGEEHGRPNIFDLRGQLTWERDNLKVRALVHGGLNKSETIAWKGPGIFNFGAPGFCPQLFTGEVTNNPASCPKYAGFATLLGRPEGEFEPNDKFTINQNTPPKVDDTFYGGFFRFDYDMGWATVTSITSYEYYERNHREDSQSDIFDSTSTHYYNTIDSISQELRLTGEFTDSWRYVAGLFYESDELDQVDGSNLSGQPLPGVVPPFADQFFAELSNDVESVAMYFNQEYDFTEKLTVIAGIRYTQDSTKVNGIAGLGQLPLVGDEDYSTHCVITTFEFAAYAADTGPFCTPAFLTATGAFGPAVTLPPNGGYFTDNRTDSNVSWKLGFEYKALDNWLVYGNLTTGYRSGGYSVPFAGAATTFSPETLFAQEVGIKTQLLDDTLRINAAVFRYDYDDVQVNVDDPVSPLVPITRNIGKQITKGAELQLDWVPTDNWFVRQNVGYLDSRYENTSRAISTYAGIIPLEGKRPVNSPEWTYSGVVRYQQPIFDGWDGILMTDYRWVDDRFLEATNQVFDRANAYWVVNARGAIASQNGQWEVAVWGKNVFNEEYLTYINNIGFFKLDIFGEQRSYGMNVRYKFD